VPVLTSVLISSGPFATVSCLIGSAHVKKYPSWLCELRRQQQFSRLLSVSPALSGGMRDEVFISGGSRRAPAAHRAIFT
jgi:hypothetical protein